MKRIAVIWMVCVLALVSFSVLIGTNVLKLQPSPHITSQGKALIGGTVTLQNTSGPVTLPDDYKGHYLLVYFGFTHCPDICPTTLLMMTGVLNQMGKAGANIVPVFITLDPERDTLENIAAYVKNFSPSLVGLGGTAEQIKAAADAYKVYYSKVENPDSAMGYVIDHSGFMYLMAPGGDYITHFPHTISEQALLSGLRQHVKH
jgi:cytochrome oxidase Cu insertion factor (SCO1/SenC/PrrC family)